MGEQQRKMILHSKARLGINRLAEKKAQGRKGTKAQWRNGQVA